MESIFTEATKADLLQVEKVFSRSLVPWWEDIANYIPKADEEESFNLIPAMVINAYRYLGLERDLAVQMANMFKTIYLASQIHLLIGDDEEGQEHNPELQFSILIGDYIFGRVLKLLLETHTDQLLNMFASMICQINEGLIVKFKSDATPEVIAAQTKAPYYRYAFFSAAQLAGMVPEQGAAFGEIGHNLGMALELIPSAPSTDGSSIYLAEAGRLRMLIDDANMPGKAELLNLIGELSEKIGGSTNGL